MHTGKVEYRRLTGDDVAAYITLRAEMLLDAPWAFLASPGQDRGSDPQGMQASLARSDFAVVGAFDGDHLVGAAGVVRESAIKRRHIATIWGVYVTPAARGMSIGRGVVAGAIAVARAWDGIHGLRLSVSERSVEARRVYESLGFIAWGTEPDAVRIDGEPHAEIHMALSL